MTRLAALTAFVAGMGIASCQPAPVSKSEAGVPSVMAEDVIAQGRYLVAIGGCNDCHTPNYASSGGDVPETERLMGNPVGYSGPWGVTYANNLRLTTAGMTEDAWVEMLATRRALPPMPWPSVRAMSETDKRAVYRYIRSLGPGGEPAPTALPPGVMPTGPVEDMMPPPPAA